MHREHRSLHGSCARFGAPPIRKEGVVRFSDFANQVFRPSPSSPQLRRVARQHLVPKHIGLFVTPGSRGLQHTKHTTIKPIAPRCGATHHLIDFCTQNVLSHEVWSMRGLAVMANERGSCVSLARPPPFGNKQIITTRRIRMYDES